MADYKEAFEAGIEAALKTQAAKIEVQSTFKDFQEQMKQLGRGKLAVELREFDVKASPQDLLVRALSYPPKPKETYVAIVAYNPSVKDAHIASWLNGNHP